MVIALKHGPKYPQAELHQLIRVQIPARAKFFETKLSQSNYNTPTSNLQAGMDGPIIGRTSGA